MPANPEIAAYIRDAAIKRGIDPAVALKVAGAEALNVFDPSQPDRGGDEGSSFGPFQLHYKGFSKSMPNPGLGDEFTAKTGLHARDPSTWRQQVDFALDTAKQDGWRQWMGAANTGIPRWAGIKAVEPQTVQVPQYPNQPPLSQPTSTAANPWPSTTAKEMQGPIQPASPYGPQFGPPMNAADQMRAIAGGGKDDKEEPRDILANAIAGFGNTAKAAPRPQYAQPKAARVDDPAIATIDPQQALMQRQQMAEIMAKLNSGKLWA